MVKILEDYEQPFDAYLDFEKMISEYTGAPYVVLTDCCTHAMELCIRYWARENQIDLTQRSVVLPHRTYLSVPMMIHKLGITLEDYELLNWDSDDMYPIRGVVNDKVYDCARLFKEDMYIKGTYMCLSFGHRKPLQIGNGGAILLDDVEEYNDLKQMTYDGRAIHDFDPWVDQAVFKVGYHYNMRVETTIRGMRLLHDGEIGKALPFYYPDLREITIVF